MGVPPELRDLIIRAADSLPVGARRRRYIADSVATLRLGRRRARRPFGRGRDAIRKAPHERRSGLTCVGAFSRRGRKPVEAHLPHLLDDIRDIVQDHLQTDPTFRSTRLYCRLTSPEVRRQPIARKGHSDGLSPSPQTLTVRLNALGFRLRKAAKSRPPIK